jgi:carbonic anhydrase
MSFIKTIAAIIMFCTQALIYPAAPMTEWNSLLESNKKIVLTCSDSRVPPELIFDKKLGALFVVRVAGQVVDKVVIDSIEYAVHQFDSHVIVVLGHSGCGAVDAALKHLQKHDGMPGKAHKGLDAVLVPIERAIVEAGIAINGPHALEEAVRANIKYVTKQLMSRSTAISEAVGHGQLIIAGAEYFLNTGKVNQLFVMQRTGINF